MRASVIEERLAAARDVMRRHGADLYIVPTADFHLSEYVSPRFKGREYLSGFTGSSGTLVLTGSEAALFTDGRYFIQAERELEGTSIRLMRTGEKGVPSFEEFLEQIFPEKKTAAFDGRTVSYRFGEKLERIAAKKSGTLLWNYDLISEIWPDRPDASYNKIYILPDKYAGKTVEEKLAGVRLKMAGRGADKYIVAALDDQAWLFNLRGSDVERNPVFFAYTIVTGDQVFLYTGAPLPEGFGLPGLTPRPYERFYDDLRALSGTVMLDPDKVNYALVKNLADANIIPAAGYEIIGKAVKNRTEIENLKKCHLKDGAAVTKFMYRIKTRAGRERMTEEDAAGEIDSIRRDFAGCVDLSFDTICAYGENAAMMHYDCAGRHVPLKSKGMLLVDSGGQYYEGTTDITRTFILGPVDGSMKRHFTLVAASMLRLSGAVFLYGCTGRNLDILARELLWREGIDYQCGTGHGVGYFLNVHEEPNAFRWQKPSEGRAECALEPGMVTTDEPGVYLKGKYGIRIENELLCVPVCENAYGRFLGFETLTFAPIDLDGIDPDILTDDDRRMLNAYHREVYEKIGPLLTKPEREWLKTYTRPV